MMAAEERGMTKEAFIEMEESEDRRGLAEKLNGTWERSSSRKRSSRESNGTVPGQAFCVEEDYRR